MELGRLQHDCLAACVTAQQYSSATFFSLAFLSHKEKFGAHLKMSFCFYFFKIACLKLRNLKLCKSGRVYICMHSIPIMSASHSIYTEFLSRG
jgi:hypothetical protein